MRSVEKQNALAGLTTRSSRPQFVGPSVLDRFRERNRLDEDEVMAMTIEEVAGHRRERRRSLRTYLSFDEVEEYVGELDAKVTGDLDVGEGWRGFLDR